MHIYTKLQRVSTQKNCVALGYFDGVHLGHRKVISTAVNFAQNKENTAVFTFTQKGLSIKGKNILSRSEKFSRIEKQGVNHCLCPEFSSFCNLTKEQFVQDILINCLDASDVFCGENFTFGTKKSGNIDDLISLCSENNIKVHIVKTALYKGETVSSTRIKAALQNGNVQQANEMLCENYSLEQEVLSGKKLGRTIGFPTINQVFESNMIMPKKGVYLTKVLVNGKYYAGATSVGTNPTVGGESITCETFIVDFSGDLYGKTIRVEFLKYDKPTIKFNNIDELKNYIELAAQSAKELFYG